MQRAMRYKFKDNSTVSKTTYVLEHIMFGGLLGYVLVTVVFPHHIPITYIDEYIIKMIMCMISTGLLGGIFSYSYNRTSKEVFIDVFSGLGFYTALTLGKYTPILLKIIFVVTLVFTGAGLILIICRKIKRQSQKQRIIINRFLRSVQFIRKNICIASVVILILVPLVVRLEYQQMYTEEYRGDFNKDKLPEVCVVYGDEYRLSENIDTIKLIRNDETFQKLGYAKKCEVLTAVLYCEGRYLGLEEFEIKFDDLDIETLGQFNPNTRCITINAKQIKDGSLPGGSAEELLGTCLHECRHYYQYLMAELYIAATPEQRNLLAFEGEGVSNWLENIYSYHTVHGDEMSEYYIYATQAIEIDAEMYSQSQIKEYHKVIDALLEEQKQE